MQLDDEIDRLEKLLRAPVAPYPDVDSIDLDALPESAVDSTPPIKKKLDLECRFLF